MLRLAASLDQVSPHVLASAVVAAAHDRGLTLTLPAGSRGDPGTAASADRSTATRSRSARPAGSRPAPSPCRGCGRLRRRADLDGSLTIFVAVDGAPAGAILLDDPIRTDAARIIRDLRTAGITRIVMVTGDRADVAETVGAVIGVDEVLAERTPAEKVEAVARPAVTGPHDHGR